MTAERRFLKYFLILSLALMPCCGTGGSDGNGGQAFTASLAGLLKMHDLYYVQDPAADTIEIAFNLPVMEKTVAGNIWLSDKFGPIDENVRVSVLGNSVTLHLENGLKLTPGWKYLLTVRSDVRSTMGPGLANDLVMEIRTSAANIFSPINDGLGVPRGNNGVSEKTNIVCFSDTHMGDDRAANGGYCSFTENSDALLSFVTRIQTNARVRELAILGDFLDEWLIPFETRPFEGPVLNDRDYFFSVRNAAKNRAIIDVIAEIAAGGEITLSYVHGNHDMLLTRAVMQEMLPGAVFEGVPDGLGTRSPVDGVVMEHGHRYDFFNAPQPLVNPGHILPPAYFITRLGASGKEARTYVGANTTGAPVPVGANEGIFPEVWDMNIVGTEQAFPDLVPPSLTDDIILMGGIGGYAGPFSFDNAKAMYVNGNIEAIWPATQAQNMVNIPIDESVALSNAQSTLDEMARSEYLENNNLNPPVNVVVFGHTHQPMLETFPQLSNQVTGIYANTGSWLNQKEPDYHGTLPATVRTFVAVAPAQWTGSDLTVVTLYQYNLSPDGATYTAMKLAEDSIDVSQ